MTSGRTKGQAAREGWERLTPEARADRVRRMRESRHRTEAARGREPMPHPDHLPMEPRLSRTYVLAIQLACTRWMAHGLDAAAIDQLCILLVVEYREVGDALLTVRHRVAAGVELKRCVLELVGLADALAALHDLEPAHLAEALALFCGIDPVIGVVMQPVGPTTAWVQ